MQGRSGKGSEAHKLLGVLHEWGCQVTAAGDPTGDTSRVRTAVQTLRTRAFHCPHLPSCQPPSKELGPWAPSPDPFPIPHTGPLGGSEHPQEVSVAAREGVGEEAGKGEGEEKGTSHI